MSDESELLAMFRMERQPAVVPWLEKNIRLPAKMAPRAPGPFSTRQRPYMRPILECWNPENGINFCTVTGGTQILKTTVLALGIAYRIKFAPQPTLVVGPSEAWCKEEISEKRLHPLINENPILACEKPMNPDLFRALSMDMMGCPIRVVGSNSATGLSGGSYGIVAIDEACKIEHHEREDAPEDHPILLAFQRTTDFEELAFHYLSSTPNISTHIFWKTFEAADQTYFWVECPHCREWFLMDLIGTDEERDSYSDLIEKPVPSGYRSLVWDVDARDAHGIWLEEKVISSTRYICPHNGCEIVDEDKPQMLETCAERRHNPNAPRNKRSFHISSFYSPRIRFGRIAWQFLGSYQDFFGLQTLYNSWLARPYELLKKQVKAETVLKLKGDHARRTIPSQPAILVLTADPGETATHWMVTAIMSTGALVVIDWGTVLSIESLLDPTFLVTLSYPLAGTAQRLSPQIAYVDSGDFTNRVYDVCAASGGFYWPTKGSNTRVGTWAETTTKSHPGLKLYTYTDHTAKSDLYGLRIAEGKPPAVVIPVDAERIEAQDGKGLIAGLSGQKLVMAGNEQVWKRLPHDHFGDTLKLALIASWVARSLLVMLGAHAVHVPAPNQES